jgi:hypothetical protein
MSDTLKRVLRTFVISFVALFVPATLGFLGEITKWAAARGEQPFPDLSVLGYAGVIAISAGLIAVLNLVVNLVEDATGKSLPGILSRPIKPAGAEVPTGMNKPQEPEVDPTPPERPAQHARDVQDVPPPW